ncbi:XRE family transcriptional regulator [Kribbella sp. NPDC051587]|uniref:XRE family transcriptional regulator n=1 Tax=Kribbella sp. NPDC051587 TaxID=3364119 RepID=UPI0037B47F1A
MAVQATDAGVRHELELALRNGPFPAALHLAIEVRGLTLEEIRDWLGERGAHLSIATLSYWRRGRSRPERSASLVAVRLLEELLELPPNALMSLLGPRRLRGRWIGHVPGSVAPDLLFADPRPEELLRTVGVARQGRLRRVSVQVTVEMGADRMVERIRVRELVRAAAHRVSRLAVLYFAEERPDQPPELAAVTNARIGQVETDRSVGLVAAELILDRVLDVGDPALLEYEWRFAPGTLMVNYEHRFVEPVREYVLQTRFAPGVVPAHCHRYDRRTVAAPEGNHAELWIGGADSALLAETDVPSGIVGMRWAWSQQN